MFDLETEIKNIARDILTKLSAVKISIGINAENNAKKRVETILTELREKGEIVDFLSAPDGRRFRDFLITVVKSNKHKAIGLAVKKTEQGARKHKRAQEGLKTEISRYRMFVEQLGVAVYPGKTDESIKKGLIKALREYKES